MKKILLILIAIYSNSLLGQVIIIKDSLLNSPIENVTFRFKAVGLVSDQNGNLDVSLFNDDDVIEISHLAYHTKKIMKKNIRRIVYLNQKTNILPVVIFTEEIKIPISEKYPIFKISPLEINRIESSIANLLSSKSPVVIQESQSGGGSPNYRGMEALSLIHI